MSLATLALVVLSWGKQAPVPYTDEELEQVRQRLAPVLAELKSGV